jgi:hypothetical protein
MLWDQALRDTNKAHIVTTMPRTARLWLRTKTFLKIGVMARVSKSSGNDPVGFNAAALDINRLNNKHCTMEYTPIGLIFKWILLAESAVTWHVVPACVMFNQRAGIFNCWFADIWQRPNLVAAVLPHRRPPRQRRTHQVQNRNHP